MSTLVWAFQPLPELKGATGFVECDGALAERLIASGDAQDPRVGALMLREIVATAPPRAKAKPPPPPPRAPLHEAVEEYDTKVMTPKKPRASKSTE